MQSVALVPASSQSRALLPAHLAQLSRAVVVAPPKAKTKTVDISHARNINTDRPATLVYTLLGLGSGQMVEIRDSDPSNGGHSCYILLNERGQFFECTLGDIPQRWFGISEPAFLQLVRSHRMQPL